MLTLPAQAFLSVSAPVKGARLRRRARPIAIQAYIRKLNATPVLSCDYAIPSAAAYPVIKIAPNDLGRPSRVLKRMTRNPFTVERTSFIRTWLIGIGLAAFCAGFSSTLQASGLPDALPMRSELDTRIIIDGVIDEPAWQNIKAFSGFKVISPDTLADAPLKTNIKMFYTERGLYFSALMIQPPDTLIERLSARDQFVNRDRISLSIDTSGTGLYAYWFAVNLGGSLMDGTILPERQYSSNWDGPWRGASQRTETGWTVEMMLPWSMMTLPASESGDRDIGIYIQRAAASIDEDWAYPGLPRTQNRFLSRFPKTKIKGINPKQQLTFYPYASSSLDAVGDRATQKAGFDLFWRPTTAFQVTGSFNPDFGNVESDNVVVNLTSYETFFPEKRPFFLEGQEIFTTSPRANPGFRSGGTPTTLINTRRIGAPPRALTDTSIELSQTEANQPSELIAATKVTGQTGSLRYGLLVALEDDTELIGLKDGNTVRQTQFGRDFTAARVLYENTQGSGRNAIGLLVTEVGHKDQTAQTLGVDLHHLSQSGKLIVDVQTLHSDTAIETGHGGFADIVFRPQQGVQHKLTLDYFDRNLDISDFGFLQRNDVKGYRYRFERVQSDLKRLKGRETDLVVTQQWNFAGQQTRLGFSGAQELRFFNNTQLELKLDFYPKRWEDRNSDGNGAYRLQDRIQTGINYSSDSAKPFSYRLRANMRQEDIGGQNRSLSLDISYQPTDRLSTSLDFKYETRSGWLLHDAGSDFTRFHSESLRPKLEVSYFLTASQQARLSLQWVGIKAFERDRWRLPATGGQLAPDGASAGPRRDFSISRLSFQARYRWEIAPLSDLFVVYTRGSDLPSNVRSSFSNQLSEAWEQALVDSLVVKIRYRFGN